jgi:hypothetical protein
MASSRATRLGASVLVCLAMSSGMTSPALGASPADPGAQAQPAVTTYTVSGTVYGAGGSPALAGVHVSVQFAPNTYSTTTDGNGHYTVTGVPQGTYGEYFTATPDPYLNGCYDSNASSHFSISAGACTDFSVNANVTGLDVDLDVGVHITGNVVNTSDVALSGITAEAYITGGYQGWATTDVNGNYSVVIPPNPPSPYKVAFSDTSGTYMVGYYDTTDSIGHITWTYTSTTPVAVGSSDVALLKVGMAKPWSISLGASTTGAPVGANVTLTATVNQDTDISKYYCVLEDSANHVLSFYGAGHTCTAVVTSGTPASRSYHAVVGYSDGSGAIATSATVPVTWGVPDHLVLSPQLTALDAGLPMTFLAYGYDASNQLIADFTSFTTFTISGVGSCTANTCTSTVAGMHTVTATYGPDTATATMQVTPAAIDHLAISPPAGTIVYLGHSVTFTARGVDKYGNVTGDVTSATTFGLSGSGTCVGAVCTPNITGMVIVSAADGNHFGSSTLNVELGGATYYALNPVRVLDSRPGTGHIGAVLFHSQTKQTVTIATAASKVPTDAVAVSGNVTVVGQKHPGYVTVAPSLTSKIQPPTSTINFPAGDTRANAVTVPLADGGKLDFMYWSTNTSDTVDILFDVTGYFAK